MTSSLIASCEYLDAVEAVEGFLQRHLQERSSVVGAFSPQLMESMRYSLMSPGKRFRPVIAQRTCWGLSGRTEPVLPYAAALEMIHAYSLIHDDLPCMDNDDERRGQPTNHKKFGESLALLAGDGLLTESFYLIASHYKDEASALIQVLANQAGLGGMVSGQAMDMELGLPIEGLSAVEQIHRGKTAALIAASLEGAGIVNHVSKDVQSQLRELGTMIGVCFQIKDDLLDSEQDQSAKSYIHHLGIEGTEKSLEEWTQKAQTLVELLPGKCPEALMPFLQFNTQRTK